MKCEYGCGNEAKFQMKNGKWCCENFYTKCPENKRKNSNRLKQVHKEGKVPGWKKLWKNKKIKSWNKGSNIFTDGRVSKRNIDEIFIENSNVKRDYIKKWIIQQNLIEYKCSECELVDSWNDKKLVLELEHKNGIKNDNRLENLTFLCPNCHSQTPTFRRKK